MTDLGASARLPLADGRFYQLMALGDSLTSGTSTTSGWRGPLKRILGALGVTNWRFVGSQSSQQGYLGDYGRDWQHEAYGGETIAQLTSRAVTAIAAYKPDVIVALMGANDNDSTDPNVYKARYDSFFDAVFARSNCTVVSIPRTQSKSGSSLAMDGVVAAGLLGWRLSVHAQRQQARPVTGFEPHFNLRERFTQYMFLGGDNTHFNEIGYHALALGIAEALAGPLPGPGLPVAPARVTSLASDLDVAEGAQVVKAAAGDTFDVTTVYGKTVRIPAAWPVGVPWPAAVVRLHSADVTGSGAITVSNLVVSTYSPCTKW
ncbi:MAG: hypothetical protein KIT11_09670 [Fimbriimonadaceae bacterium]|nr:hypothetical protein [Fimbriimonadaceae bacterium]QYK55594.1 MAG: hypothetical protein KF733_11340 [Fimbriimonadaceae bacterium]